MTTVTVSSLPLQLQHNLLSTIYTTIKGRNCHSLHHNLFTSDYSKPESPCCWYSWDRWLSLNSPLLNWTIFCTPRSVLIQPDVRQTLTLTNPAARRSSSLPSWYRGDTGTSQQVEEASLLPRSRITDRSVWVCPLEVAHVGGYGARESTGTRVYNSTLAGQSSFLCGIQRGDILVSYLPESTCLTNCLL